MDECPEPNTIFGARCRHSAFDLAAVETTRERERRSMTNAELSGIYRDYIACLNQQDWPSLARFVDEDVRYNGECVGLPGYRAMLEGDFRAIPDLYFDIRLLVCEPRRVASRLRFDCTPLGMLFGLPVNGRRVSFDENVFYEFRDGRIEIVWSVIDKAAIASQL
jgi:predicted ester cyclase